MQFDYLHIRKDLFEDYYRDTSRISKEHDRILKNKYIL